LIGAAISRSLSASCSRAGADQPAVLHCRHAEVAYDLLLYREFVAVRPPENANKRKTENGKRNDVSVSFSVLRLRFTFVSVPVFSWRLRSASARSA
jgi:hypothetical protein